DGGARKSGMAHGTRGKERAEGTREARGHIPAEGTGGLTGDGGREHGLDGCRGEHVSPREGAAVEEHAAEAAEVVHRREGARVPGHPLEQAGVRIMDDAAEHGAVDLLGGRDARAPSRGRAGGGIAHAERLEDALARKTV